MPSSNNQRILQNNQEGFQRVINKKKGINQPTSRPITTQDVRNYSNIRKARLKSFEEQRKARNQRISQRNQEGFQRVINKKKGINQSTSRPITTQDVRNYAERRKAKFGLSERKSLLEQAIERSEAPVKKPVGFPVKYIDSSKGAPSNYDNIMSRARGERLNALHGKGNNYSSPKTTPFLITPAKELEGPTIGKAIENSRGIRRWMLEHPKAARRLKKAGKIGVPIAATGTLGVGGYSVYKKAKKAIQNRVEDDKRR